MSERAGADARAGGDARAGAPPGLEVGGARGAGRGRRDAAPAPRHVYVHVPFCAARCDYCEFYSVAVGRGSETGAGLGPAERERLFDRFVAAVGEEWGRERERWGISGLETVFIGGGTPSLLGRERLERLLESFETLLTPHAEVTVETNPDDVTPAYAAWAAGRRLRVSLGVQSFDARLRSVLGRRAVADPEAAFAILREAGVAAPPAAPPPAPPAPPGRSGAAGLGIDLIFGLPGQRLADVETDLATVARLRPDHVSWYELGVVPGSALAARLEPGGGARLGRAAATLPDDDALAALYRRVVAGLGGLGFDWYEVSNFARPGHRCRHNSAVWRGRDYLGLGPGAVGTVGLCRQRDLPDVEAYLAALESGAEPPRGHEELDDASRARERLLLAARTGERVALDDLGGVIDRSALAPLAAAGLVSLAGGTLRVTRKGRYVANGVCVRLFRDSSFLEA